MAEQSKFAGALGRLKQPSTAKPEKRQPQEPTGAPRPEPIAKAGRGGKRSDPAYSPATFFIRKETKRKAAQLLLNGAAPEKDLSDIVESLLAEWVSERSDV
jgi:hypothetical protein